MSMSFAEFMSSNPKEAFAVGLCLGGRHSFNYGNNSSVL